MGSALIMFTIAEETLAFGDLCECDERGREVSVGDQYDGPLPPTEQLLIKHPGSYYKLAVLCRGVPVARVLGSPLLPATLLFPRGLGLFPLPLRYVFAETTLWLLTLTPPATGALLRVEACPP